MAWLPHKVGSLLISRSSQAGVNSPSKELCPFARNSSEIRYGQYGLNVQHVENGNWHMILKFSYLLAFDLSGGPVNARASMRKVTTKYTC